VSDNITLPREVVERVETLMKIANKWSDDVDILASTVVDLRDDLTELRTALAAEQPKTPAWWRDGLAATLMREGVNKHRAREIAVGYWEAYCQIPGNKEDET
jgi:hypothetical protein